MPKLDAKFGGTIRKVKDGSIVPDDQWVVFLAKDSAFAEVLPLYQAACARMGADDDQLAAVDRLIDRMNAWREANPDKVKVPDAKGEKLADVLTDRELSRTRPPAAVYKRDQERGQ